VKTRKATRESPLEGPLSLHGKRAPITGAAAGIGRAIARRLVEAGAALELVDSSEPALERVGRPLDGIAHSVYVDISDIGSEPSRQALWDSLGDHTPEISVDTAGTYPFKGFLEVDRGFCDRLLSVNSDAVY
jgi:NAD(P)-dependent dehydrogenase (short-subunit alcohol dehydrogenase family)